MPRLWTNGVFWFSILALPVFCLSRDFAWKSYKRFAKPEPYHIVQEVQKCIHSIVEGCFGHDADMPSCLTDSTCPTTAHARRSSRKQSRRSEHCNARGGTVALPSRRRKKVKRRSFGVMTRRLRRRKVSESSQYRVTNCTYVLLYYLCPGVSLASHRYATRMLH